ncbi:hypothetical protein Tco_0670111 [Tanacetum coccineum]
MIDCLSIVETDKVIHTIETDIVKLVVEIESFGMSSDKFDKEIGSSDGLQPKQADLSCVHALNELHLHEIRSVPNSVKNRFDLSKYEDPQGALSKLLQIGTVAQYQCTSNATAKSLAIKWISPTERQERLSKVLCFNCDNQWVWGHKCPSKFLLLMADEDVTEERPLETEHEEAIESGDISIHNSLVGHKSPDLFSYGGATATAGVAVQPEIVQLLNHFKSLFQVSQSPFLSPVLLVEKKDGSYRFCVDEMFDELGLTQNLLVTKHRMERQAIWKRWDVEFNTGDMVLVKLQPYCHVTLVKHYSNKFAKRYYGPSKVLERVGKEQVTNLAKDEHEGQPVEQPLAICDTRIVLQKGIPVRQVFVQ